MKLIWYPGLVLNGEVVMNEIMQSQHLVDTHYELRGAIAKMADQMLSQGESVMPLHLGNPGLFGLHAHDDLCSAVKNNLVSAQSYCHSLGLPSAREAILSAWRNKGCPDTSLGHVFIGNGVSELINASLIALLNPGDEILLPQPVYPLWSAAASLCGAIVKFYRCDEQSGWMPDVDHMKSLVTRKTKALVLINPNNPTGAVYPPNLLREVGEIASLHGLVLFADEIYSDIIFDETSFSHAACFSQDTLVISFDGLSKNYLLAGFRCAWMICTGRLELAKDYIEGIKKILSMRLCANVPPQYAIPLALSDKKYGFMSLVPDIQKRRDVVVRALNDIDGCHCLAPKGAFYVFPRWDNKDEQDGRDTDWVLHFLQQHKILLAPGSTFSQPDPFHFRMVLLPELDELTDVVASIAHFMSHY